MPCNSRRLHEENQLRFSNSKHCRFYWTMLKTMRLGVLSWGHLRKNHELRPAWESKSNCWSFRYVYCLTSQKASKVRKRLSLSVSKLAIVLIWNIQSPHEDNLLPHGRVQNHNIKSSGHNARSAHRNDRSKTVVVSISGAFVRSRLITNGVYTRVTHLHIAVPTITCSLPQIKNNNNHCQTLSPSFRLYPKLTKHCLNSPGSRREFSSWKKKNTFIHFCCLLLLLFFTVCVSQIHTKKTNQFSSVRTGKTWGPASHYRILTRLNISCVWYFRFLSIQLPSAKSHPHPSTLFSLNI